MEQEEGGALQWRLLLLLSLLLPLPAGRVLSQICCRRSTAHQLDMENLC